MSPIEIGEIRDGEREAFGILLPGNIAGYSLALPLRDGGEKVYHITCAPDDSKGELSVARFSTPANRRRRLEANYQKLTDLLPNREYIIQHGTPEGMNEFYVVHKPPQVLRSSQRRHREQVR